MEQPHPRRLGQLVFLFVRRVQTAVLQVAEGGGMGAFSVLVHAPDQPHRKLPHHRLFDKQVLPARAGPGPARGQGLLQPEGLGGHGGLDLLFQGLELGGGLRRKLRIVLLAGGGHGLELFPLRRAHLQLQGRGEGHVKLPRPIVEGPVSPLVQPQVRDDPVRQLLRGEAQLLCRVVQGASGGGFDLLELEFPGHAVHRKQRLRLRAEGQGHYAVAGDRAAGLLGPLGDLPLEGVHHLPAPEQRREGQHPLLLGGGLLVQPQVEYPVGVGGQLFLVQILG